MDLRDWTAEPVVGQHLQQQHNEHLVPSRVTKVLKGLEARGLVERSETGLVRLSEPDTAEAALYELLRPRLSEGPFLEGLGVGALWVLQETSTGGPRDGRFSRPDFTLAEVRRWRFDPQATLEVYSLEVKNRSGAKTSAVYEAVAHSRLVHHSYLVCPRSTLYPEETEEIRRVCASQGVGLALFDLTLDGSGYAIGDVKVDLRAQRRAPDPAVVEKHLIARLNAGNAKQLEKYARQIS